MKDLCVLVTGATKGIGWSISQSLADQGCHVVGIAKHNTNIDFPGFLYGCDLLNAGQTEENLRIIREKYPVDAIVNAVGCCINQDLGEIELSDLYNTFDLNVRVAVQTVQAFIPSMKARRSGRIVNISSYAANGMAGATSYSAAKSALLACTKTWAKELAPYQITVNSVSPGPVETESLRTVVPVGSTAEQDLLAKIPLGRLAQSAEIAHAVSFLLSPESAFITGQDLGIDGGASLSAN